jgi:TM2 domain-containing membrane protein YozV
VHKFYLGKIGLGIVYILFCWTFIPAIIAFVEGIIYLVQDDKTFSLRQGVAVTPS